MRGVKLWLALSLALNLFLLGALAAGALFAHRALEDRRRAPPLFVAARSLPAPAEQVVRERLRAAAGDARSDFRAAREARRHAAELAGAADYDREATLAALRQAAAAEMRGRDKLDSRLTEIFADLEPGARKAMAPSLARPMRGPGRGRHGGRGRRGGDDRDRGSASANGPAAQSQAD